MELLFNLYKIHSMSGQENQMRKFIKDYVRNNVPGATVEQKNKNIYIVKGESETYPCVVAHLDQVQTKHSKDFKVFEHDGILFGYSAQNKRQEGLGADDKNGIWVALKCLERFDNIKVAFFHSEEIGTVGSENAEMDFFKDVRFVLEADRRNGGDLITNICGMIASNEFINDIMPYAEVHGYKETTGMLTDVETLSDNGLGVSAVNMSCGYYNPHTDEECTDVSELENCLAFAMDIIENCKGVYPFERKRSVVVYSPTKLSHPFFWGDDDDDWGKSPSQSNKSVVHDEYEDEDVQIVDFNDYANPWDALYDFCYQNMHLSEYDLWYYVSADCDTYGITYEDFADVYDSALSDLCEYEDTMYSKMF